MTSKDKLHVLLEKDIIPDLESAIDELFEEINDGNGDIKEHKEDLDELRDMRTECFAILEEIKRDELSDEEVEELLAEFTDMRNFEE
ncbi:conserved hypothetical protein [Sulfurovum sp. enrichment culture clone C5]|uniref:Uncharacterized protein n=1 Tax=Sulfurovum sp. enrichment culture clone C5 TaxID=497650 RepID=A0A0S4XNS8_9BACT|nr:conserved hypothetical protein [Sulfurovum sp. enrichment culture clone C5]